MAPRRTVRPGDEVDYARSDKTEEYKAKGEIDVLRGREIAVRPGTRSVSFLVPLRRSTGRFLVRRYPMITDNAGRHYELP